MSQPGVFAETEAQLAAGHRLTARDSYLRATISASILSKNPERPSEGVRVTIRLLQICPDKVDEIFG
jgi:hypothetical protein